MNGWWALLAGLAVGTALLLAPGWALGRSWGLRGWATVGAALPLSCLAIGSAELAASVLGLAWVPGGWVVLAAVTVVLSAPALLLRGRWPGLEAAGPCPAVGPAVGCAAAVAGAGLLLGMGAPDSPVQAYDAVFHINGVQAVRESGSASPLGGLALLYHGASSYYPTLWHGTAALLPGTPVVATNALIVVLGAVCWPVGVAALGVEVLGGPGSPQLAHWGRAVAVTTVLASACAAPTVLLTSLAVWPYALSVLCLPGVLVLAVRLLRASPAVPARTTGARRSVLLLAGAAGGAVAAHGTGLFNLAVLLGPAGLLLGLRRLRADGPPGRRVAAIGAVALLVTAAGAWLMRASLASVLGYSRPGGSALGTLGQALLDLPQYGPLASRGLPAGIVLLVVAVIGARSRQEGTRLWTMTALSALLLVVLVGGPQWWGRQVGFPWYLQKSRIEPLVLIAAFPLAFAGCRWLLAHRPGRRAGAALLAVALAAAGARLPLTAALGASVHDAGRIAYGTLITPEEVDFYERAGHVLPADAVVVGAPSLGTSYLWSLGAVRVAYPIRSAPASGTAEAELAASAPDLRPGSRTCELLSDIGAEYYLSVDRPASGYSGAPLRWDAELAHWPTDSMEVVATSPTATIWRITACG
ncbi:MAG: beta-carotene 15,15'-monooxygenase [Actinomyces sp.]|uniref:DUF6541 family protein n=1 Tax=Actinomyces sp. TaxID=29317 RepID=UPI0026DC1FE4|nr:DUF6541 family protein [Actinomyces sp.]MDO4242226.1 beta-carotene 15,15'-monooxygenase [Actinomyces sp.]